MLAATPANAIDLGVSNGIVTPVDSTPCKLPGNSGDVAKAYRYRWQVLNPPGGDLSTNNYLVITGIQLFVNGVPQAVLGTPTWQICTDATVGCACTMCTRVADGYQPYVPELVICENGSAIQFDLYAGTYANSNGTTFMRITYDIRQCGTCKLLRSGITVDSLSYEIAGPAQGSCPVPGFTGFCNPAVV